MPRPEPAAGSGADERAVSLGGATAIVVASMIGTGVYASLGFQLVEIPSPLVILSAWALGGVLSLCGAISYAELVVAFPRSGGEYHLLSRTWHPVLGFLSGWISITAGFAAPIALAAMAFGAYLAPMIGWAGEQWLALGLVVSATGLVLLKVRLASGVLMGLTGLKAATLLTLIGAAVIMDNPQPVRWTPVAADVRMLLTGPFAVSLIYVMYSYSGWNASSYIVNEVRAARRTVPRSLLLGTVLVTGLYTATQAAFLRAAPAEAMRGEVEVGLIAARALLGRFGGDLLALLICVGLISSVAAMIWSGSRVGQMLGEDYGRFRWLAATTPGGTPWVSVSFQSLLVLALLATSSFQSVAVYLQAVLIVSSTLTVLGVFRLRNRRWWVAAAALTYTAMGLFMLIHVIRERPAESAWGAATLLVGLAAYPWHKILQYPMTNNR